MSSKNVKNIVFHIALPVPLYQVFDYTLPNEKISEITISHLNPGIRIKVPFGKKKLIGILLSADQKTDISPNKIKPIVEILDDKSIISLKLFQLLLWASDYYHHPIGDVLINALPVLLRKKKSIKIKDLKSILKNSKKSKCFDTPGFAASPIILNTFQKKAVETIQKNFDHFQCFLLNGVTGSGKTEVYLTIIDHCLQQRKQALVLIPEIALTPQTVARFQKRFSEPITVLHSGLTDRQRLQAWINTKKGDAKIIIGTRSAIFSSFANLGLIIIDEEHDASFKQQEGFRYSARDMAVRYAQLNQIPIILGSATPSLESLYNVSKNRYMILELPNRAGCASQPAYHFIDIRNLPLRYGLSKKMLVMMQEHLKRGNQVLIFLNRRGYAPTLMCHVCGWVAQCPNCDAHMTLHQYPQELRCHHCERRQTIPKVCPTCHSANLDDVGTGTQRLEEALLKYFPHIPVVRIDRDTTKKKNSLESMIEKIQEGHRQILIGTQMLAKGHHFPNVTLVGIINADSGFFSADFRSIEHIGQLILQVSGRAGRAEKPGEVFIQTHHPENPFLLNLVRFGYQRFAKLLLQERKKTNLPPYVHFILIKTFAKKLSHAYEWLTQIKKLFLAGNHKEVQILGPITSPMTRRKNMYHAQLLFQAKDRRKLHQLFQLLTPQIKSNSSIRWSIDVDPITL